jgi:hypothetical protein
VISLCHEVNRAVAKSAVQHPKADIGVDRFEFWTPRRRPGGHNLAFRWTSPPSVFGAANLTNGISRPTSQPNAWVADFSDRTPSVMLSWPELQTISCIQLSFDTDFDHPMESVLWGHPEREMPFCVKSYRVRDGGGQLLAQRTDNHLARNVIELEQPILIRELRVELDQPTPNVPAAMFEIRCYANRRVAY